MNKFLSDVLNNALFKRSVASLLAGGGSFLVLRFLIPELLTVSAVSWVGAAAVAYIVWSRVAVWELDRIVKGAQDAAKKIND